MCQGPSAPQLGELSNVYDPESDNYMLWFRDTDTEVVEVTNPATGRVWMDGNREILLRPSFVEHMDAWVDWNLLQDNPAR